MQATIELTPASGATAASNWLVLDRYPEDTEISMLVEVAGTATYSVQYALENVGRDGGTPVAIDIASAKTTTSAYSLSVPAHAVRLISTAGTSSSTLTFRVIQAGS